MSTTTELEDAARPRLALVTGGGRGIGRAIVEHLASVGCAVAINYNQDAKSASELAEQLRARGASAQPIQADVTDPDAVSRMFAELRSLFGSDPDVLVNNVGEFSLGAVSETHPDQWRRVLDSNLNSAYYVTHEALPPMRRAGYGRVIFIGLSPTLTVRGAPNLAAYAVAKTGVAVLTRSLAVEEARFGVTVNCIAPGLIDNGYLPPDQERWMSARVPSGRLGRPQEVAEAVGFLVSDSADYVSGATLSVSGAWDWEDRPVNHDGMVTDLFSTEVG